MRVPVGEGDVTAAAADAVASRFHDEHAALYGYDFRADPRQQVEWVNLRVTGIGPIRKPALPEVDPGRGAARAVTQRAVYFEEWQEAAIYERAKLGAVVAGPAVVEEFSSTVPVHSDSRRGSIGSGTCSSRRRHHDRPVRTSSLSGSIGFDGSVDPVLVEIVAGYLASVEREVETAIGRTSRSPMIRDAHDYRAGIHDRHLRKLTGRSYSALVHPVARDYPIEDMRPGDVFFHNDVYLSEGGIGHLPDLCVTAPVFHDAGGGPQVVAFVQAFGHHDDIGGAVPGSMPSNATSVFEEGLMVPPIKLWDGGPCEQALKIMTGTRGCLTRWRQISTRSAQRA